MIITSVNGNSFLVCGITPVKEKVKAFYQKIKKYIGRLFGKLLQKLLA